MTLWQFVGLCVGIIMYGLLVVGCATIHRLGPDEAVVIVDQDRITCAGAHCVITTRPR